MVSSHLLSEIEQVATRMLIIDRGRKIVEGNVEELVDPSKTSVLLETTDQPAALHFIRNSKWEAFLVKPVSDNILLQIHKDAVPELNHDLVYAGIGVVSLQAKNSLENYFLQITAGKQYVGTFTN